MAITNLTNTTWVFKSGEHLKCNSLGIENSFYIDFTSNSTSYHQIYREYPEQTDELYYGYKNPNQEGTYIIVLVYTGDPYGDATDFTWYNDNYQTIQITSGEDVYNSDLIEFLSDNAICQTPLVTVTFNMNGIGTAVSSQTFASGEKVIMPTPSAEDYIFAGWYTDPGLTTEFDFNTSVTSDITLYAKWVSRVKVKVDGAWRTVTPLVKVNNIWKDVNKLYVKVDGVWKEV